MSLDSLYQRYKELQAYVGWTDADAQRVHGVAELLKPHFADLIDDFYEEIQRHPSASKVITGGSDQIERLKETLRAWLRDLVDGPYDEEYVARRWRVGWRHVEIGLSQIYTNVALSRLRCGLHQTLTRLWVGDTQELHDVLDALNRLLDLDLAIIEDAYQSEYLSRQQRVERMATIGQMAAGVAHEVRQPLNVIKTSVYYLQHARNTTEGKTTEHLDRIERQVELANRVITAMTEFARQPNPDVKRVELDQCVKAALEMSKLPKRIEVTVDIPSDLPAVMADADQLQIVLSNLFRNARDAMPTEGMLTISAQAFHEFCEIIVSDTGVGINPDILHRIMEPLYTTKPRGLGFGLAVSRAIIEKHGGQIRADSEVGQGAKFLIRLLRG